MYTYIDISTPLHPDTPTYPGDPPPRFAPLCSVAADGFSTTSLHLHSHTGTHLDPPRHLFDGAAAADDLPLDLLCGPARVVDLQGLGARIGADLLRRLPLAGVTRLLLKTDNAARGGAPFDPGYAALIADAAPFLLAETQVRLIGIDALSIEVFDAHDLPVHRALLGAAPPILILEGLDLRAAEPGDYELLCLPLRLQGGDGAPARAVLRR